MTALYFLAEPCPSRVLQQTVSDVLTSSDDKLATPFINSVLNQLNWAFSEFVGMIQELQQLSARSERSFVEMRQLKICATCFDISVGLLRVIEMVTSVAGSLFLDAHNPSSEILLSRLYQVAASTTEYTNNNTITTDTTTNTTSETTITIKTTTNNTNTPPPTTPTPPPTTPARPPTTPTTTHHHQYHQSNRSEYVSSWSGFVRIC